MRRAVGTTRLLRWRADGVMCGIGGYVGPKKDIDAAALLRALAARGPDGEGVHHRAGDGWNGVLAHRRLAVLDPTPASAQPFVTGDHALTFNGEIFNFRALRAELEAAGARFVSQGDTEVVLHGLRLLGPAFLERLRGPFALGLLDGRSGTLLLARDRLGVNPLYVSLEVPGGGVAFASTTAALHAAGLCGQQLDVRGLCGFLFYGSVPEPLTLTRGVTELPPGSWLEVDVRGNQRRKRYWRLPAEDPRPPTPGEVAGTVRAALLDAVTAELVSDVPVAVLLSSGLDSTAVAALAARVGGSQLEAFTVGFEAQGPAVDESALAAQTAADLGMKHRVVFAAASDGAAALRRALAAQDLPSMDGLNTHLVSAALVAAGYKVALSGLGGDELFLGYKNRANFHRLAAVCAGGLAPGAVTSVSRLGNMLGMPIKLQRALTGVLGGRGVLGAYAGVRTIMSPAVVWGMLAPEVRAQVTPEDLDPVSYLQADTLPSDVDGALSRLELGNYLRSTLLKDSNQLSLAQGLELRVPFMDHRLVETVLRVPGGMRAQGTPPKPLLRAAMGDWMPAGVAARPKVGFVLPLQRWLEDPGARVGPGAPVVTAQARRAPFPLNLAVAALDAWWERTPAGLG
jgi:asparagine synthase (glutamine-hydrolysing)